ncbi:ESPR-type extended signal peptide-containing protein, partial [Avibacterium paragallinarum]
MNKIFKVIFNRVTNRHEVVSEFARNRVKASSGSSQSTSSSFLSRFKLSTLTLMLFGLSATLPSYAASLVISDNIPAANSGSTSSNDTETIETSGGGSLPSDKTISKKYAGYQAGGGKTDVSYDPSVWSTPAGFNESIHRGVLGPNNSDASANNQKNYTGANEKYANSVGTIAIGGGNRGAETHSRNSVAVGDGAYAKGTVLSVNKEYYRTGDGSFLPYNPNDPSKPAVRGDGGYWLGPATALGFSANADGSSSTSIGAFTQAKGDVTTALGGSSKALADYALAIGSAANALADRSIAQGTRAKATAKYGIAIGNYAQVGDSEEIKQKEKELEEYGLKYFNGIEPTTYTKEGYEQKQQELKDLYNQITNATALGAYSIATSRGSSALGAQSEANAERATAVGGWAEAHAENTTAVGAVSKAFNERATAIGDSSTATGARSTASGFGAKAGGYAAVAMGDGAKAGWTQTMKDAMAARNTAIDKKKELQTQLDTAKTNLNQAYRDNNTSNIATYTQQVNSLQAQVDAQQKIVDDSENTVKTSAGQQGKYDGQIAIGSSAEARGQRSVAIGRLAEAGVAADANPTDTDTNAGYATALGNYARATNNYATVVGANSAASGEYSTALGASSTASKERSTAVGHSSGATEQYTTAVGDSATATALGATALGQAAKAFGEDNLAVGKRAYALAESDKDNWTPTSGTTQPRQTTALGNNSKAYIDNSVALGYNSKVSTADQVSSSDTSYLTNKDQSSKGIVSVGQTGTTLVRRITAVADGVKDDDAVTVAQLKRVQLNGGGALKYQANDANEQTTALTDGLNFKTANNNLTVAAGTSGQVTYGLNPVLTDITSIAGNSSTGPKLDFSGTDLALNNKKITGVATGVADTDAVNVKQLKDELAGAGTGSTTTVTSQSLDVTDTGSGGNHAYAVELKATDKATLAKVGTGDVADNNQNTVTGDKVFDALTTLKTEGFQVNADKGGKQKQSLGTDKTLKIAGTANEIETETSSDNNGNATVTLKLADKVKQDIAAAAAKSVDLTPYAKKDGSNITNPDTWRTNLDVYSKGETDKAINDSRTEVVGTNGIEVTPNALNPTGKTTYTVGLDAATKQKIEAAASNTGSITTVQSTDLEVQDSPQGANHAYTLNLKQDLKNKIDNAANKNLDNLDPAGKTQIKTLAKEAVSVVDGKNTSVTNTSTGDNVSYAVNVQGDLTDISSIKGSGPKVQFNQGGVELNNQKITGLTKGTDGTDAVNVDQLNETAKLSKEKVTNDDGTISVTEGTQAPGEGKNFVVGLSKAYKEKIDQAAAAATNNAGNIANKADINLGNIDTAGKKVIKDLITLKDGTNTTVQETDVNGVKQYQVNVDLTNYAKTDASNIPENNVQNWVDKLSGDTVVKPANTEKGKLVNEKGLVNYVAQELEPYSTTLTYNSDTNTPQKLNLKDGTLTVQGTADQITTSHDTQGNIKVGLAQSAVEKLNKVDNKLDKDLGNLDATGKGKIQELVKNTVEVQDGTNTTVSTENGTDGKKIYKVNVDLTPYAKKSDLDGKANAGDVIKADGSNVTNNQNFVDAIEANAKLTYKANGTGTQEVALSDGLNFKDGKNTTATVGADGVVTFDVKPALTDITSISGNGTTLTLNAEGANLGGKKLSGLKDGEISPSSTDAVTGKQLNTVASNTIALEGDTGKTDLQRLDKNGGISFKIEGNDDIVTAASDGKVALSLSKGAVADNDNKVVTGDTVKKYLTQNYYNKTDVDGLAKASKEKVTSDDNSIKVTEKAGTNGEGKTFDVALSDALKEKINNAADTTTVNNALDNKADKSLGNLDPTGTAKVKALAKEAVSVANGVNTTVRKETTGTNNENDVYKVDVKGDLTEITSIQGGGNKVQFTADGVNLNTQKITGLAEGTADSDAVNVAQLNKQALNYSSDQGGKATLNLKNGTLAVKGTNDQVVTSHDTNGNITVALAEAVTNKLADVDNKANKTLDNLDPAGNKVIQDLAKGSIEVKEGNNTTVTTSEEGGKKVYKVNVDLDPYAKKTDLDTKANANEVIKSDGSNVAGNTDFTNAIAANTNLAYKANGQNAQSVSLANGLNFTNGKNTTASVNADGVVSFAVNPALEDITSVSGKGSTLTFADNGLTLNNKTLSGLKDATLDPNSTEAVTGRQLNAIASNTIKLTGDKGETTAQNLNKQDGIAFKVEGNEDISTSASGDKVALTLNKGSVAKGDTKVVSGDTVKQYLDDNHYNKTQVDALAKASKEKVTSDDGTITVTPKEGANGEGKTFDVALSKTLKDKIDNAADEATVNAALDGKANVSLNNIDETGKSKVKSLAKEAVTVVKGTNTTVTTTQNGENVSYAVNVQGDLTGITSVQGNGKKVEFGADGVALNSQKITGLAAGTDANDAVNVSQLDAKTLTYSSDKGGSQTLNLKDGTLTVKGTANQVVTSHDENGNITIALADEANRKLADVDNKANKDLDNLTTAGTGKIQEIAKNTVEVKAGKNTTVDTEDGNDGKKIYKVNVDLDPYATKDELAKKANADEVIKVDGSNVAASTKFVEAIEGNAKLAYKANGQNPQSVTLAKGLDFKDGTNTTATVGADGAVTFDVKPALTGINSVTGNGTTLSLTNNGATLNNKKLSGLANGEVNATSTDAVTGQQLHAIANNTFKLTGDTGATDTQNLNNAGGLSFKVEGSTDITTNATGDKVTLALNKGSVADNENRAVSGGDVKNYLDTNYYNKGEVDAKAKASQEKVVSTDRTIKVTEQNGANGEGKTFDVALADDLKTKLDNAANKNEVDAALAEKANKNLDNLDPTGVSKVKTLAKEAIALANGVNTTVSSETQGDKITYKVNVNENLTGIKSITGDGKQIQLGKDGINLNSQKITGLTAGVDDADAVNVAQLNEKTKASKENVENTDGTITVTKGTPKQGEGTNFVVSLSDEYKGKINDSAAAITRIDGELANKANVSLDNINEAGKTVIKDLVKLTDGQNTSVEESVGANGSKVYKVNVDLAPYAKTDASNITNINPWVDKLSNDTVVEPTNGGKGALVNEKGLTDYVAGKLDPYSTTLKYGSDQTGSGTVDLKTGTLSVKGTQDQVTTSHDAQGNITVALAKKVTDKLAEVDNKANANLDNITPEGQTVVKNLAKSAVEIEDGLNTSVSSRDGQDGKKIYKVDVNLDAYATKAEMAKKADDNLGNITAEGRKVITNLVKGAGDNYINVTENVDGNTGVKTLNVAANIAEDLSPENGLDNKLVSAKAAKAYTDSVSLNTSGDEGTGTVNLKTQRLAVTGKTGEIKTAANAQGITIALDDKVKNEIAGKADQSYVDGNFVKSDGTNVNSPGFLSAVENNAKLSYKANNGGAETVSLAKGLDFTNGTNTTATVKADGVVTFDVNKALTGMTSIGGNGTTVNFTADGINLGDKKITGLAQGTNATDAVNVEQLDNAKKAMTAAIDAVTLTASDGTKDTDPVNLKSQKLAIVGRNGVKTTAQGTQIEVSLADAEKQKLDTLGTGTITKGNNLTVTGGTVATALETKANTDMNNLTAEGKKAVANLVTGAATNDYASVTNTEDATTGGRKINVGVNVAEDLTAGDDALANKVASAKASKTYTDSLTLSAQGDTGTGASTNLRTGSLKVKGKENEVTTDATGDTITIGLAKAVTDKIDAKADKAEVEANYIKKDGSNVAGSDAFINAIQDNAKLTY